MSTVRKEHSLFSGSTGHEPHRAHDLYLGFPAATFNVARAAATQQHFNFRTTASAPAALQYDTTNAQTYNRPDPTSTIPDHK